MIGFEIIEKRIKYKKKRVENCLSDKGVFDNSIRLKKIQSRANEYLDLPQTNKTLTNMQCAAIANTNRIKIMLSIYEEAVSKEEKEMKSDRK